MHSLPLDLITCTAESPTGLVTALRTRTRQPHYKSIYEDDELITLCPKALTHAANGNDEDNDGDNSDNGDDSNSNDSGSNDDTDWYNHLVDKPPREHGCQTKEGREGWGMADILSLGQPMRWVCAFT